MEPLTVDTDPFFAGFMGINAISDGSDFEVADTARGYISPSNSMASDTSAETAVFDMGFGSLESTEFPMFIKNEPMPQDGARYDDKINGNVVVKAANNIENNEQQREEPDAPNVSFGDVQVKLEFPSLDFENELKTMNNNNDNTKQLPSSSSSSSSQDLGEETKQPIKPQRQRRAAARAAAAKRKLWTQDQDQDFETEDHDNSFDNADYQDDEEYKIAPRSTKRPRNVRYSMLSTESDGSDDTNPAFEALLLPPGLEEAMPTTTTTTTTSTTTTFSETLSPFASAEPATTTYVGRRRRKATPPTTSDGERNQKIQEFLHLVKESTANSAGDKGAKTGQRKEHACTFPGCKRKFLWKWAMEEHAATHMPESGRVHKCTYCPKSFFTVGCLKSHMRIHTRKPYSYVCKVPGCTKKYCTSEGLRLHTRNVHEVDKKWKCPAEGCTKQFVRQSDLRLHIIRIHSKERPYPCTHKNCNKSFACYSELKRHLNSHRRKRR